MKNKTKNGNKVLDIISTILVILLFFFGATCLIFSFTGNTIYLFGTRYDVCLTDSMSSKNEKYLDFLENYENQIQPFDLVISKKINEKEELNVGDIVLYKNPYIGTDCHRIVDIVTYIQDEVTFRESTIKSEGNNSFIYLNKIESGISTNQMKFTSVKLCMQSKVSYHNNFNFNVSFISYEPKVKEEYKDGLYNIELSFENKLKSSASLHISHSSYYDYSEDRIVSLYINSNYGEINVLPNELELKDNNTYSQLYNVSKKYEIRGDKAPNSDGYFTKEQIYSKVISTIPKIGYPIRFFSSIWGMILIVGIIVIITLTDFGLSHVKEYDEENNKINFHKEEDNGDILRNDAVNQNLINEQKNSHISKKSPKNDIFYRNYQNIDVKNLPLYVDENGDIRFK